MTSHSFEKVGSNRKSSPKKISKNFCLGVPSTCRSRFRLVKEKIRESLSYNFTLLKLVA